jgi:hypothetical protein
LSITTKDALEVLTSYQVPVTVKNKSFESKKILCGIFIDTRNYVSAAGSNFLVNSIYEYTHHMRFSLAFVIVDA